MTEPQTYATCPRCELPMAPGTSCCECPWRQDGREIPPIRFGSEVNSHPRGAECRDCNTPRGGTHHYDCCVEECPHGRQAITCDLCVPLDRDPYAPKVN